jgi:hypothetical protein
MVVKEIKYPKAEKAFQELMKSARVDAGYFEGMVDNEGFGLPDIAYINEIGTDNIPSRPFMSRALENAENEIASFASSEMSKPDYTAEKFFKKLGLMLTGKIKFQIRTSKSWAEKNADSTIKRKTRNGKIGDQPLVDNGTLLKSPDFKVYSGAMAKVFIK